MRTGWWLIVLVIGFVCTASRARAVPTACELLPAGGLPAYFGTDMPLVVDTDELCAYASDDPVGNELLLTRTTFALKRNARDFFKLGCVPPDGTALERFRVKGVRACGIEGPTTGSGGDFWLSTITLRHGRTVVRLSMTAPASSNLAHLADAKDVAVGVVKRWR